MSASGAVDDLLVETIDRLLGAAATFDVVESAETDGWSAPLWNALAESGFPWISVPESAGGTGGTLAEAMAVLRGIGRHAAPVPVAETGVLGGWLAAEAGFAIPDGPVTVVPDPTALQLDGNRLRGSAVVPWGARAERVLALVASDGGWIITSVLPEQVTVTRGSNLAGEPRDTLDFDVELDRIAHAPAPTGIDGDAFVLQGALTRVNLAAGALGAMAQMTIDYAHERRQFGRPVAAFQAVQQHLVSSAQAAARAAMAADVATRAASRGPASFEVAAARIITNRASVEATRAAHQAHGAMGVTREYPLHHLSRRLWAWQHEFGSTAEWSRRLGSDVVASGAGSLFPSITS